MVVAQGEAREGGNRRGPKAEVRGLFVYLLKESERNVSRLYIF